MNISSFGISRAILFLITMLLLVLNFFGNDVNIIGIAVFILYLTAIFVYRPIEYANNLLFFIIIIPMIVGGALIERGTYLFEIDAYGSWNGTFIVNLFFSLIFIEFLLYRFQPGKKKITLKVNKYVIEGLIAFSLLVLYGTFLKTGIPLFNGIHRTVYFGTIVPDYVNLIKGRLSFVSLALGYYYFNFKSKRYALYLGLIILYHILCSIKGGEVLIVIYAFYLPITLYYICRLAVVDLKKINKRIRLSLLIIVGGLFSLIFLNYQTVENYDSGTTPLEKIVKRVESAGQIWWMINDENQVKNKIREDKFLDNFVMDDNPFNKGMNQLMTEVVPGSILDVWREPGARGRSLANGFPAIGYYYFGYAGVIAFIFILGTVIVLVKKDILSSFESGDVISFLFIGPILEIIIRVIAQGDINLFFEKRAYAIFICYMIYGAAKNFLFRWKRS